MTCIFISHTHSDQEIAKKLVEYLVTALRIDEYDIRCTSVPGYMLPPGTNIERHLKKDINADIALIGLLTQNGLRSQWVLFELGASWGMGKLVIPILGPELINNDLPGPLKSYRFISIEDKQVNYSLNDMIRQLANYLGVEQRHGVREEPKRDEFIKQLRAWKSQLPDPDVSQQERIKELTKKLEAQERSHNQQLEETERAHSNRLQEMKAASQQKKEELEQSLQSQIRQLKQQLTRTRITSIKIIKIFLASSSELKDDREKFEIFINRKNKEYIRKGIFLELVMWEDFLDAMSQTRLQDEYKKAIANCDVFVSLFHTKVGQYTEEEFLKALATFKTKKKLLIYTYFKDEPIPPSRASQIRSLFDFKDKLSELGHFYKLYKNIDELKYLFDQQLDKFIPELTDHQQKKVSISDRSPAVREQGNSQTSISTYRQKYEEFISDGELSEIESIILKDLQQRLGLKAPEVEAIHKEASELIKQYQKNLNYYQQLVETKFLPKIGYGYSLQELPEKDREDLKKLQVHYKLKEKDIARIETELTSQFELKSEKGIDYTKLRDLLAAGNWKEADQETARLMREAAKRKSTDMLSQKDLDNFPCEDLRTINQLWIYYSDGKFGFSVQKEIYESLGGRESGASNYKNVFERLGEIVGWRKGENWVNYSDLFDMSENKENNTKRGHLPSPPNYRGEVYAGMKAIERYAMSNSIDIWEDSWMLSYSDLFCRAKTYNL